ncbi:MAG: hypothetical protein ABIF92_02385 [archaeon]
MKLETQAIHYPNLKTVLMVENALQKSNTPLTREQLKSRLPMQVMHQTLNIILEYLERSGKIIDSRRGIVWIFNESTKLEQAITAGKQL